MKPHKWHKEIKAWADGAEIEAKIKWSDGSGTGWHSIGTPHWESDVEYRIKPQPKEPQYLYAYKLMTNQGLKIQFWDSKVPYDDEKYIGKIKLEDEDV